MVGLDSLVGLGLWVGWWFYEKLVQTYRWTLKTVGRKNLSQFFFFTLPAFLNIFLYTLYCYTLLSLSLSLSSSLPTVLTSPILLSKINLSLYFISAISTLSNSIILTCEVSVAMLVASFPLRSVIVL